MISREHVLERSSAGGDRYPLLTVREFFHGNEVEDSIAPNQCGYGRPDLAEIARRLDLLAADPAVAWMRVQLHEEMFEDFYEGLAAEAVAICTTLAEEEVDTRLDVEGLQAEPVWEGLVYDAADFCDVPPVPDGYRVLSVGWD
ncbi:hypothetical protein [Prescottella agglutinans]|uniref:Uncharacterized protein n=1 Tax=Prescottella agglutinans TaxID=1644129 RepID=A0ABT6M4N9_9NOCA|nr:hypothetical protein [Prescottella agglutinans]MDH6279273.1 hypothetical protein [Prescottella agglutinans]